MTSSRKPSKKRQQTRTGQKPLGPAEPGGGRRPRVRRVWLNVLPENHWLRVQRGITIWEALQPTEVELPGDCGGMGKCGKCKVRVLTSIGLPQKDARTNLTHEELHQGVRLACRTKVSRNLQIQVGDVDPELDYVQMLKTGERPLVPLDPLVSRRLVTLAPADEDDQRSDLARLRSLLGPNADLMTPSLAALRGLSRLQGEDGFQGAAVLHDTMLLGWQRWAEIDRHYAIAFDLGTSTLVGKLINLLDGTELAAVSRLSSQARFGADVISRLQVVRQQADGRERLTELLVKDLNFLIKRLCTVGNVSPAQIFVAVAAGNTTMQHLLLGLDPARIAEAPFTPVVTDGLVLDAAGVGLDLHPAARLYVLPACSGYIGGDLVAAILASGTAEQDPLTLGLDLGTNGEIFLGNRERLLTCSAAAGPALEGARISQGMIARAGAIEAVGLKPEGLELRIVGNVPPRGLCGSGLVDLVAVLLHLGLVDREGLITTECGPVHANLQRRVLPHGAVQRFLVALPAESHQGQPVYLTQQDVRELQLAKGAIAAGIDLLLGELGCRLADIERVALAGALGNYVHPISAMRIGLLPRVDLDLVESLGNAASTGATMGLLSRAHWEQALEIAGRVEHVELSSRADFNGRFVEHLDFPDENLW